MRTRLTLTAAALLAAALLFGWLAYPSLAQEKPKAETSPSATPSVLPRPDFHFPGNVGRTYLDSDPPQFPQPVQAPQGAPNVVLILLDDVGFGQFSTFGGGVPSPTMDKLAAEGLRYNRFHTAALCSPTRAALITGRNHHSTAFAGIAEGATGYDGYTAILPRSTGTVGEVLRQNGYMTAWVGKNHNTPTWETSAAGPFDRWANGLGFDYFYGFNGGDTNQWNPVLYENRNLVPASTDANYHLTADLADKAIAWVRKVKTISPDRPFFLYVAPGATHSPHHAPKEWIERFKGKFDMGWDTYREETFARQKKLGVIPASAKLTPRPQGLPAWDALNTDQKRLYARMMEVFAAFGAHCDHHMGRIVEAVRQLPGAENTLFIYIAGDNGASAEGGIEGSVNENLFFNGFPEKWQDNLKVIDELGGPKHFNHFPSAWAHAMDTPFQWTKQVASHFGGTRNSMIVSWPARIKDRGGLRAQFLHVIDIVPTLYEVIGITLPMELNGVQQKPIEGISFAHTFDDARARGRRTTQYFEIGVNRGIYHNGWMASALSFPPWQPIRTSFDPDKQTWEIYNIDQDFSQADDLAAANPQKLRELQDLWWVEAARYNVLPLDWRAVERLNAEIMGRPSLTGNRKTFTYYPGQIGLPNESAPRILNKSWILKADIEVPDAGAEGMIVTHGGLVGGYGLYVRDGKPTFVYNDLARRTLERRAVEAAIWGMPMVAFDAMRQAFLRDAGAQYNDIVYWSKQADWKLQVTTPNASSWYVDIAINTQDGPVVLDLPPAVGAGLFGSMNDAWQIPQADVGPAGEDQGKGGKYLLLPPGYTEAVPAGYIPVRFNTYNGYSILRAIPATTSDADVAKALDLVQKTRVYALAQAANPPPQRYIDMAGKLFDGIARFDDGFYDSLARMVNEEPVQTRDLVAMGQLRSIGIEQGKEFKPDAATRDILKKAIAEAHAGFIQFMTALPSFAPGSQWTFPGTPVGPDTAFVFEHAHRLELDERAALFFFGCAPPKRPGAAAFYLLGAKDAQAAPLHGSKTYRLRVPPHVPARQFWDAPRVELNSYQHMQKNADGSVDVFFGPTAPAGKDANWVYTAPGKQWVSLFRFYGPEKAVFEKTWKLPDIEAVAAQ